MPPLTLSNIHSDPASFANIVWHRCVMASLLLELRPGAELRGRRWMREAFTSVAICIHDLVFVRTSARLPEIAARLGSQPLRRYRANQNGNCAFAEEALQRSRKRFQMFKYVLKV